MKHSKSIFRLISGVASTFILLGAGFMQSCEKDVLSGQPEWLGNSLYERLQSGGNFSYTLRLIDDLGQTDVLKRTGSKTLFVADDAAYDVFFKSNNWSVRKYEDLSMAQKKLLFNSTMVNDAYLIELLSNVSGNPPQEGQCMRRETAVSVFDSISRIYSSEMPNTKYWDKYRNYRNGIVLLRDNTPKPMIHFLPIYMQTNKIMDNDFSILTNGASKSVADAWVNGKKIIERDITCKNGYLHQVDGVMMSSDNMAGIIHNHQNMSTFAQMLDRFSAPYYDDAATKEYNRLNDTNDSVFVMRYFAETANTGNYGNSVAGNLNMDPSGQTVDAQLFFDPGWNQYMYSNTSGRDLHYDAGAMLVPSNAALDYWWNHDGKVLQNMYGSWDNVPIKVLVKMMNINMINTFSETVPSKFNNIVDNTTKVPLGVTTSDVDSCFMGCNGVIYLTN
ncbi:MAG: fasciclin domain-containing protein, partial [Bacteroidota bacterium]|nr:fasciclin domain-containing protein [Bacteroidota bacterium]